MELWIINGPNLNMLGMRQPEIYGRMNFEALIRMIDEYCTDKGIKSRCLQSNHEGDLVDYIQMAHGKADGLILNPGAYTHTSIALLDALLSVGLPAVEVHISNPEERELFRKVSYIRDVCLTSILGHGVKGYLEAVDILINHLK